MLPKILFIREYFPILKYQFRALEREVWFQLHIFVSMRALKIHSLPPPRVADANKFAAHCKIVANTPARHLAGRSTSESRGTWE